MTRQVLFYDTEFYEDGNRLDLISIGIVNLSGRSYYAVNEDLPEEDVKNHPWLSINVWPYLPTNQNGLNRSDENIKTISEMKSDIMYFINGISTELWAYYGAYDHVLLSKIFGRMIDLPPVVPKFTHELMQLWEQAGKPSMPEKPSRAHNALEDAYWNRRLYKQCMDAIWGSTDNDS